jgi:hypothetical protein
MIISRLKGGLGNYLFQVAAGYSLSLDNNTLFSVDLEKILIVHSHWRTYMNNIFRNINTVENFKTTTYYIYESLTFKEIPFVDNCLIDGYYQSEKYFINNKDKVLELLAKLRYFFNNY